MLSDCALHKITKSISQCGNNVTLCDLMCPLLCDQFFCQLHHLPIYPWIKYTCKSITSFILEAFSEEGAITEGVLGTANVDVFMFFIYCMLCLISHINSETKWCQSVCCVLTTSQIVVKFCINIHGLQRMIPGDFVDSLSFHLARKFPHEQHFGHWQGNIKRNGHKNLL